jgi:Peptidase propeptide and YPEB domain
MKQRIPLLLAAGLAAFMLVLAGGLAAQLLPPAPAAAVVDAAGAVDPALPAPPNDPALQTLLDREAAYEQALQQANAQLQQAYQDQERLAGQVRALQTQAAAAPATGAPAPAAQPAAPAYALSPQQAGLVALRTAPGASLTGVPDVVDFQGQTAYEVRLTRGLVYIDANSGQVLYNGATTAANQAGHDDQAREHQELAGDD